MKIIKKAPEEVVKQKTLTRTETAKEYILRVFPLEKGEFKVDPRVVGENRFRVLFWKQVKVENCFLPDNKIERSYYVVLKKDGTSWTHEVLT